MDKREIISQVTALVLEKGASLKGEYLSIHYSGHIDSLEVFLADSETYYQIGHKIHYFGETYGNSIEEILTWLQTL